MFERFTQDARQAVTLAQGVADRLGADHIGPEHVLVGAATVPGPAAGALARLGVGRDTLEDAVRGLPASALDAEALARVGIDLDSVRAQVEATFGPGALDEDPARRGRARTSRLPFDVRAKKLLELALREALTYRSHRIDTGHLLLGAVRDQDSPAHRALLAVGVTPDDVRAAVVAAWAGVES
ncbi:Clp protease N-terminal domain-containing protein [Cellulomonas sp. URHB0016]